MTKAILGSVMVGLTVLHLLDERNMMADGQWGVS